MSDHLPARKILFISHATPEDSEFSRWLSLQLIGLGYSVWCDVLNLKGGEDFWSDIEATIRTSTAKFLYVLTKVSNQREGTLKELAVANKVKKQLQDPRFIIPLHGDHALSYDDVNIEMNRLNSIDFKKSWSLGLKSLIEALEEMQVQKSAANFDMVNRLWRGNYLKNRGLIFKEEIYCSNWFPIVELPPSLLFHHFGRAVPKELDVRQLPYPALRYGEYLATFAHCYDFLEDLPGTERYLQNRSVIVPIADIFNGSYHTQFLHNREAKRIIIQLLNTGFDKCLKAKPVSIYQMSNKISVWIKKGTLEKDKFNKVQLVGKQKEKNWHFGISGSIRMFPENCVVISPHIWFTTDGHTLIPEPGKQHAARRKQGKGWWNNDWRNKIVAFMQFLSVQDGYIGVRLGQEEYAKILVESIPFRSPISYVDPGADNLPDDDNSFYDEDDADNIEIKEDE